MIVVKEKKKKKEIEETLRGREMNIQMNLFGERIFSHTMGYGAVCFDAHGMVSSEWLSACKEARTATRELMEKIVTPSNLVKSYNKVRGNGGSAGVDGMQTGELKQWLKNNSSLLIKALLEGQYFPEAVLGVEVPKPQGGTRQLGIPTVIDRFIQQCIHNVLSPYYEKIFSNYSYGFRPGRHCIQALKQAGLYVQEGYEYVVDIDLEKFFDKVNHDRLEWHLSTRIGDQRLLTLIRRYLKSGLMQGGIENQRIEGTPQGGPLSPLLSNIVLDELDKELERRGHKFVRYADDLKIFVKSEQAAQRVMSSVTAYIEDRMKLKVNREKSRICKGYELNFLGHSILTDGSLGLSKKSEERLKQKVKEITVRRRGISLSQMLLELRTSLQGWLLYFRHAKMSKKIERIDGWIKRKIRCFKLKQCKRCFTVARFLMKLGVGESLAWRTGLSGKGWWRLANSPGANIGMTNVWLASQGYYSLTDNYKALLG